jgi:hypothetical protein
VGQLAAKLDGLLAGRGMAAVRRARLGRGLLQAAPAALQRLIERGQLVPQLRHQRPLPRRALPQRVLGGAAQGAWPAGQQQLFSPGGQLGGRLGDAQIGIQARAAVGQLRPLGGGSLRLRLVAGDRVRVLGQLPLQLLPLLGVLGASGQQPRRLVESPAQAPEQRQLLLGVGDGIAGDKGAQRFLLARQRLLRSLTRQLGRRHRLASPRARRGALGQLRLQGEALALELRLSCLLLAEHRQLALQALLLGVDGLQLGVSGDVRAGRLAPRCRGGDILVMGGQGPLLRLQRRVGKLQRRRSARLRLSGGAQLPLDDPRLLQHRLRAQPQLPRLRPLAVALALGLQSQGAARLRLAAGRHRRHHGLGGLLRRPPRLVLGEQQRPQLLGPPPAVQGEAHLIGLRQRRQRRLPLGVRRRDLQLARRDLAVVIHQRLVGVVLLAKPRPPGDRVLLLRLQRRPLLGRQGPAVRHLGLQLLQPLARRLVVLEGQLRQAGIELSSGDRLQQAGPLLAGLVQKAGKVTLGEQHRAAELLKPEPDLLFDALQRLLLAVAGVVGAGVEVVQLELGRLPVAGQLAVGAVGAPDRPPALAVAVAEVDLGHRLDGALLHHRQAVGAKARRAVVQGQAQRIEQGALAGAGRAADDQQPGAAERPVRQLDLEAIEAGQALAGDGEDPHGGPPASVSRLSAVAAPPSPLCS